LEESDDNFQEIDVEILSKEPQYVYYTVHYVDKQNNFDRHKTFRVNVNKIIGKILMMHLIHMGLDGWKAA